MRGVLWTDGKYCLQAAVRPQLPCESVQRQLDNPSILGSWATYSGNTEIVGGENSVEERE